MEWLITGFICAVGLWLAFRRPDWLLDYAIIVLAFNRGLRRIVDYYFHGAFNPLSTISLTPLVVAGLLLIPVVLYYPQLQQRARLILLLLGGAVTLGLASGIFVYRLAAIYSLVEWGAGLSAMAYAATMPVERRVADRWIKTAGWCAVGVAAYGVWQYYSVPPWDVMWMTQSGIEAWIGKVIEPGTFGIFSTLSERGPCGTFLAWAVIPMIINPRWRNAGGWFSVAFILWAIVLTYTRSNMIMVGMVALLYPALSKGLGTGRLLALTALVVTAATWGVERIPGMERTQHRFGSESLYGEGSSLVGRMEIYQYGWHEIVSHPLGHGLGSSGMGRRAERKTVESFGDSGYIQIFVQFGWLGGLLFFGALWWIWLELKHRWIIGRKALGTRELSAFIPATRAILLASLVFLFVTDIFAGFSLLWIFFGRALSLRADPVAAVGLKLILNDARMPAAPEPVASMHHLPTWRPGLASNRKSLKNPGQS